MNNFIISFSGASHSGKTTFMEKIKNLYPNDVILLDEFVRNFNINIDEIRKNPSKYLNLELNIISEKINAEKNINKKIRNKLVLIDRSLVDSYFYYIFYVDKSKFKIEDLKKYHKFLKELHDVMIQHVNNLYNIILFFKPIEKIKRKDNYTQKNINITQKNEYDLMSIITNGVENKKNIINVDILKDEDYLLNLIKEKIEEINENKNK